MSLWYVYLVSVKIYVIRNFHLPGSLRLCVTQIGRGRGWKGSSSFPLPIPFNPDSCPIFVGTGLFALLQLQNFMQIMLHNFPLYFLPLPISLGNNPASCPGPSVPTSRTPPLLFSPRLPPRLPCPPPQNCGVRESTLQWLYFQLIQMPRFWVCLEWKKEKEKKREKKKEKKCESHTKTMRLGIFQLSTRN